MNYKTILIWLDKVFQRHTESLCFIIKGLKLTPSSVNPYYSRINYYIDNGNYDLALEDIASIKLSSEDPDSYYKEAIIIRA